MGTWTPTVHSATRTGTAGCLTIPVVAVREAAGVDQFLVLFTLVPDVGVDNGISPGDGQVQLGVRGWLIGRAHTVGRGNASRPRPAPVPLPVLPALHGEGAPVGEPVDHSAAGASVP